MLGAVHERKGEVEAALHPAGVRPNLAVGRSSQTNPLEELVSPVGALVTRHAVERGLQPQMLAPGEQRVEGCLLERGADRRTHLGAFLDDVVARDTCAPVGRRKQRRQHVHCR